MPSRYGLRARVVKDGAASLYQNRQHPDAQISTLPPLWGRALSPWTIARKYSYASALALVRVCLNCRISGVALASWIDARLPVIPRAVEGHRLSTGG